MPPYLQQWWNDNVVSESVEAWAFLECVVEWYENTGSTGKLVALEKALRREGIDVEALGRAAAGAATSKWGKPLPYAPCYLEHILLPLADEDMDGQVTSLEMVSLQMRADEFSTYSKTFDAPTSLHDLFSTLHRGFDKALLREQASLLRTPEVVEVTKALGMQEIINSYKASGITGSWVLGMGKASAMVAHELILAAASMCCCLPFLACRCLPFWTATCLAPGSGCTRKSPLG